LCSNFFYETRHTRSTHRRNHVFQIFSRSVQELRSSDTPKIAISHCLAALPSQQCDTAERHCVPYVLQTRLLNLCTLSLAGSIPNILNVTVFRSCIDLHEIWFVGKASDHVDLIKFWLATSRGRGSTAEPKFWAPPYYTSRSDLLSTF